MVAARSALSYACIAPCILLVLYEVLTSSAESMRDHALAMECGPTPIPLETVPGAATLNASDGDGSGDGGGGCSDNGGGDGGGDRGDDSDSDVCAGDTGGGGGTTGAPFANPGNMHLDFDPR